MINNNGMQALVAYRTTDGCEVLSQSKDQIGTHILLGSCESTQRIRRDREASSPLSSNEIFQFSLVIKFYYPHLLLAFISTH